MNTSFEPTIQAIWTISRDATPMRNHKMAARQSHIEVQEAGTVPVA